MSEQKFTPGPTEPFDVRAVAEIAARAIYTHGFGFREVIGPSEHDGRWYINFAWDDDRLVRAIFWMSPDEALGPEAASDVGDGA